MDYIQTIEGAWRHSELVCALADADRHLGHLIRTDGERAEPWHAFDATHQDEKSKGFRYLGAFCELADAKQVVELAVAKACVSRVM